jgi:prevent-host-death family protein
MEAGMATVTIHQAKTNLSKLIARVEAGEEIWIARGKQPVVRLLPVKTKAGKRGLAGLMKGKWPELPDSFFFDPLPEEELKGWEDEYEGPG